MIVGNEKEFKIREDGYYKLTIHNKGVEDYNVSTAKIPKGDFRYDLDRIIDFLTGNTGKDVVVKFFSEGDYHLDFEVSNDVDLDTLKSMDFEIEKIEERELIEHRNRTRYKRHASEGESISIKIDDEREYLPVVGEKCIEFIAGKTGSHTVEINQNIIDIAVHVTKVSQVDGRVIETTVFDPYVDGVLPETYADDITFKLDLKVDTQYRFYFEFYRDTNLDGLLKTSLWEEREMLNGFLKNTSSDEEIMILQNQIKKIDTKLDKINTLSNEESKFDLRRNNWYDKVKFIGFDFCITAD